MGDGDLAEVQRFVTEAVRRTTVLDEDDAVALRAKSLLVPSPTGMAPSERLEVYREQFWLRHLSSLSEDFPTLTWVLGGSDAFRELATAYLVECPPRTWDLQRLGADLPRFVAARPRLGEDVLACDAARLDWAFMEAFDAPDSPPLDVSLLAGTPEEAWPAARIELHASLQLLLLEYPAHDLRVAVQRGADVVRPLPATSRLVVYRDTACFLRAVAVDPLAFGLLERLRSGTALGDACEDVARASGKDSLEIGAELGGWFQQWTAAGWIRTVRVSVSPSPSAV